jgi:hypothetical protein
MKGTLFSADFVKDTNGNLRLLELNTDTSFTSGALHHTDFTDFINVLSTNNIDEVHVIYKEVNHSNFIEVLSQSLHTSDINPSLILHKEEYNTIYPATVEDANNKFILRLAYDESAIFDSIYCKQNDELLKLFNDNNDNNSIPEFYISSSEQAIDTLNRETNIDTAPDIAVKNISDAHASIEFYKIAGTGSNAENFNVALDAISEGNLILNYYNDESANKHKGQRSFNIIYGSNLDLINLADVTVEAILEKPTEVIFDAATPINLVSIRHYYELTTNYVKFKGVGGLFEDDEIQDVNGNPVAAKDTVIGDEYKSTYIEGTPDSDSPEVFSSWSFAGSELPSGSYVTSSILIGKVPGELDKNIIQHIQTSDGASFRVHPTQHLLIYNTTSDSLSYKVAYNLDKNTDRLVGISGSNIEITTNEFEVLEGTYSTYVLDMEPNDTFVLHNGDLNIKIVTHNCFPAGTKITLEDGSQKNIEDLSVEDILLTYNTDTKKYGKGTIGNINVTTQNKLIKITTSNGGEIKSTPKHKFFCVDNSWTSAEDIKVGDILFNQSGDVVEVSDIEILDGDFEVFHIINVKDDHTYFAEELLVHNVKIVPSCFPAGTEISMKDGDVKNIEDIVVGDEVLTFNEETGDVESNKVYETLSPIHNDLVKYILSDGSDIVSTFDHPYYVNGLEIASYYPEKSNELYDIEKEVIQIKVGDVLNKLDGSKVVIESIEVQPEVDTQTYLLRVENNHNFYAENILVHNK